MQEQQKNSQKNSNQIGIFDNLQKFRFSFLAEKRLPMAPDKHKLHRYKTGTVNQPFFSQNSKNERNHHTTGIGINNARTFFITQRIKPAGNSGQKNHKDMQNNRCQNRQPKTLQYQGRSLNAKSRDDCAGQRIIKRDNREAFTVFRLQQTGSDNNNPQYHNKKQGDYFLNQHKENRHLSSR